MRRPGEVSGGDEHQQSHERLVEEAAELEQEMSVGGGERMSGGEMNVQLS